jgi:hypothetical protein
MGNRQHHIQPYIFTLLLLAFLVSSCAVVERPHPPEAPELLWEGKTPAQVLDHLRRDNEKISDMTAAFSLSVDPPPEGQPSHIKGVMFYARGSEGPCVRIKGLGLFGFILFDLVQKEDEIQIYVPSQQTLFKGRITQEKGPKNVWGDLFKTMFSDFSGASVSGKTSLAFNDEMVIVPLENGEIRIERKSGLIRQWHHRENIVIYDHYDQKPGGPPVPTHITLSSKDGSRHAVCRLSQINVNSNLTDVFDLSGYEPKNVRDLNKLEMMSGP